MANACLGEDAECFDCSQFRYTQPGLDLFTKEDQASAIFFPAARALVSILILDGIPCARSKSWLICQGKGYSDCTADAGCSWSGSTSPGGARFCNTRTANVELDAQQKQSSWTMESVAPVNGTAHNVEGPQNHTALRGSSTTTRKP